MHEVNSPPLSKWPFFAGDILLLATGAFLSLRTGAGTPHLALAVLCVAAGAVLAILPFVLEYRTAVRLAESKGLNTAITTIQNLDSVASQISSATAQWQEVQQNAEKMSVAARQMGERMTAEVKGFAEFMERVNDREKAMLKVELEKLHRAENDWLQVLIRMLDHVYALYSGALRSSQPNVIDQVGHFQNACRDVARRVGVSPFVAGNDELFDSQRHQVVDSESKPQDGATIAETVAAGYTFQGKLIRPALVRLRNGNGHSPSV